MRIFFIYIILVHSNNVYLIHNHNHIIFIYFIIIMRIFY